YVVLEFLRLAPPHPSPSPPGGEGGVRGPRVLDIGTGSGNLAIAAAQQNKSAKVTAIDISPEALAIAARNAERHKVADRIRFLTGDSFEPLTAPGAPSEPGALVT